MKLVIWTVGIGFFLVSFLAEANEVVNPAKQAAFLAKQAFLEGDYEQASQKYQLAYQETQNAAFLLNAALSEQKSQRYEEARKLLLRFIEKTPETHVYRGQAKAMLSDVNGKLLDFLEKRPQPSSETQPSYGLIEIYVAPSSLPAGFFKEEEKSRMHRNKLLLFGLGGSALVAGILTTTVLLLRPSEPVNDLGTGIGVPK